MRNPFPGIDPEHPWVKALRLPVIKDMYPKAGYFVTLTVPEPEEEATNFLKLDVPTEEDARIAALYLQYVINSQRYITSYINRMAEGLVAVDNGHNTVSLAKRKDGTWIYRRNTWNQLFAPMAWEKNGNNKVCNTLMELLDYIELPNPTSERQKMQWAQWKQDNNLA